MLIANRSNRRFVDQSILDLVNLGGPALGTRNPVDLGILSNFKAGIIGLIEDVTFLAFTISSARTAARELRRTASSVIEQADESIRQLERTKTRAKAAVVARSGAVGFEKSGTPGTVSRALSTTAFKQAQFIRAFASNLAQQLIRKARRIEKAIDRKEDFAIGNILQELGRGILNLFDPIPGIKF